MAVMVRITHGTEVHEVAMEPGWRVLSAGYKAGLDEKGFGDCGGNCSCGTCHVRVKTGTFPSMGREEEFFMNTFPRIYADSRLGCQLVLRADQDLVEVEWVGGESNGQ